MKPLILSFYLILAPFYAKAEDELDALMQRLKSVKAVKKSYQESRSLEFFDDHWYGKGFMYARPPDLMIRQQTEPKPLLMGIIEDELYYFDSQKGIRHQTRMDIEDPLAAKVAVFKALITGDRYLLERFYQIEFKSLPERWLMTLTPRHPDMGLTIVVSGQVGQEVDTITVEEGEDRSEFILQLQQTGAEILQDIDRLTQQLRGE